VPDFFRNRKWDLVGHRNIWFAISLLVIVPGIYAWATKGLNYGIDFTGGGLVTYRLSRPISLGQEAATLGTARQAVAKTGIEVRLQFTGEGLTRDYLLVRTRVPKKSLAKPGATENELVEEQSVAIKSELDKVFPGLSQGTAETVSPVISKQLLWNAVKAVSLGCVFILLWVWFRYAGLQWAGTAVVALVHDVLVLIGVFALTQKEVNSPFVAAALTVVGFSVHDTIIIYDRIRENVRLRKGATFSETTNTSLLETLARSVNTVLTVELVLIAAFLFGGASLKDFTFALIIGVTTGAYSSIFNASQLLVVLKNREERALARRRQKSGRMPAAPAVRRAAQALPRPVQASPQPASAPTGRPAPEGAIAEATRPPGAAPRRSEAPARPVTQPAAGAPRGSRKKLRASGKRKRRF
jgi:preprotein translocase subunit SecF